MKTLLLFLSLLSFNLLLAQWSQIGSDLDGEAAADQSGYSASMPDSNTVGIGAKFNDGSAADAGHVRIFRRIASNWVQKGSDIDGEASGDYSGHSISMPDSNTIAIGAPNNDGNGADAGHVRIFEWNGSSWGQKGIDLDGEAAGDFFGYSLSMPDQNTLAVGARGNDGNGPFSGHVRVFRWSGSAWIQKGLDIDGESVGSQSGYSVSMPDSNTVAIGAYRNNNPNGATAGHVRVYQWNGSAWIQKGSDIDGESAGDQSGYSLSMPDSNTVAVGAILNNGNGTQSGHTRIYSWNGLTWVQKGADIDGEAAGDRSGSSLAMIDSNMVAIGAYRNTNAGHVRIFFWDGTNWSQLGSSIVGEEGGDQFGYSLSMVGSRVLAIGANQNNGNGTASGHVRVFSFPCIEKNVEVIHSSCPNCNDGSISVSPAAGIAPYTYSWSNSATDSSITGLSPGTYEVTITDASACSVVDTIEVGFEWLQRGSDIDGEAADDGSGYSVSMGNVNTVAIGAPCNTANGFCSGHVRVFEWNGTIWVQKGTDIDGSINEFFGYSVSMADENTLAIGAFAVNAGLVRIYDWNGTSWVQRGADINGEALGDRFGHSVSMADANTVGIGGYWNDGNGTESGHVRVYEWNGASWVQKGVDIDGEAAFDRSGNSVSMPDANTIAIGAVRNDGAGADAGHVRVYQWNGTSWAQKGTDIDGEAAGDNSGSSVSMPDPNTVAVGAQFNDGNGYRTGHVRIFEWNGTTWVQKGSDIDGEGIDDWSGFSVSMPSSNSLAIGAYRNDGNGAESGHARVFNWNGSIWEQVGVDINSESAGDQFGYSVSMADSSILAVGATGNDGNGLDAGHVRVFGIPPPCNISASITAQTNVSCNGGSDGSLTVTQSGGTTNFNYAWSNGSTTANTASSTNTVSSLNAGTYTVTITDNNSCTAAATATITQPSALVAAAIVSSALDCNGDTDGQVTASGSGGTAPYTYSWNTGETDATETNLAAGTYYVTVTDNNGCTDSASVTITEPTPLVSSIANQNNVSCNGDSDGSVVLLTNGGTSGGYTFNWSNSPSSLAFAGSLSSGAFTVTVSDPNGCTTTVSGNITEPASLTASISTQTNVDCNGNSTGASTASGSGGTPPYNYSWSNAAGTATNSNLSAGTYTATITDNNSCTATTTATITEPTALVASISAQSNVDCNGNSTGSLTAAASGGTAPYVYNWSNGGNTASISALSAGTYTATITDNNSCTATTTATITEPAALVASISSQFNVDCNGNSTGAATASGSGGTPPYNYSWSNTAGTATNSNLSAGTYTVTITDNNACTATTTATITEPAALNATISSSTNVSCNGGADGSATAVGAGGTSPYTYLWSNSATTTTINNLSAGVYTVTITDNNACTATTNATITEPAQLFGSISPQAFIDCFGAATGAALANATGGTAPYTYLWSNAATTASVSGLSAGTYSVTITDANGCSVIPSATFVDPTPISASFSSVPVSCFMGNDGSASVSTTGGTPGYTYNWSNSASTATINNLTAGTYSLTITDANGCTHIDSVVVNQANPLSATVTSTDISCFGLSDGSAIVNLVSGGTAPYTYLWSNTSNTAQILNLSAGVYTVTITDNNGCTYVDSATITMPSPLSSSIQLDSNTTCFTSTDGGVTANVTGGTMPYTYIWSNSSTTASLVNVGQGVYDLTVTDANGCSTTDQAIINVDDNIPPSVVAQNLTVYLDLSGQLTITGAQLDNGSTDNCSIATFRALPNTFDCSDLGTNIVTLTAVDDNGNQASANRFVTVIDSFRPTAQAQDISVYLDSNRNAIANAIDADNASSDNCSITQYWLSDSTFSCTDKGVNQVSFYVRDAQGNRDTAQINITVIDTLGPVETMTSEAVCDAYLWDRSGVSYTTSGLYTFYDTLANCDSIFMLDLEVRALDLTMVNVGDSLFAFQEGASYQWYDCRGDSIIPGVTSKGYRPDTTGFYTVIIDNGLCFDTAACQEVIVVGIKDQQSPKAELKIYPNPTTNDFFFETSSFGENEEMVIYDMKGSIILRKTVDEYREKIETDNWNAGVYFVRFGEEVRKVVVSR